MMAHLSMDAKVLRDRLSRWDSCFAPLSDNQKEIYVDMNAVSDFRPLPSQLPLGGILEQSKREGNSVTDYHTCNGDDNSDKFLTWINEVESQMQAEQERCYRDHSCQLQDYRDNCSSMLIEVGQALQLLLEMKQKHELVSRKTGALHQACERLVDEQTRLISIAESISSKLLYFTELEHFGHRLSSLSVGGDTFAATLARLDECIHFIEQNPTYKESHVYLARYRQCLSNALNLVKQHVITALKSTTKSVLPSKSSVELSTESSYSQYYGRFRTNASKIKMLVKEIEQRSNQSSEYQTLLKDCHQCYVSQRGLLLVPIVNSTIESLKKTHTTDNCALVRSGCNFLSRICQDEYHLFFNFFELDGGHLGGLLESLCYSLYDMLRPVIVHTNHLETLAELCTIFKVEMLEERIEPKGSELAVFGGVVNQMLEDVQQRLVFRAQRFIQTDIRGYTPAAGDLAYPDKLLVANEAASAQIEDVSDSDSVFDAHGAELISMDSSTGSITKRSQREGGKRRYQRIAAADMHTMWYPTVRRTITCLSKLYRCIEKPVFEGVAHEALSECVKSLSFASSAIMSKNLPRDSQLFLIKHLLILREQIAAFDVNFTVAEVTLDWTKTKAAAYGLLKKKSRMFSLSGNNAFLEFFLEGIPDVVETHFNSKKDVDVQLKCVCEKFISDTSTSLVSPLKSLLQKFDVIFQLAVKDNHEVSSILLQQPFAAPSEIHKVVVENNALLKKQVPTLRHSLSLYLANEETEHILLRPCRANVLQVYENLEKIVAQHYSTEDKYIVSCPSQDQVSLMLTLQD